MASCNDMDEYTNPHFECIKKLLIVLVGYENDIAVTNTQLRAVQTDFDAEMQAITDRCAEVRKSIVDRSYNPNEFAKHIHTIDEIRELFADKIKVLTEKKDKMYNAAKQRFSQYTAVKYEYYKFHEATVNHFKSLAVKSGDPQAVLDMEKKINKMNSLYLSDVQFIKQTEHEVEPFFKMLRHDVKTTDECFFQDNSFIPKGKHLDAVQTMADEMKITNLPALRQALAQAHVYQATDIKAFVSAYLLHLDKCEQATKEKMKLVGWVRH